VYLLCTYFVHIKYVFADDEFLIELFDTNIISGFVSEGFNANGNIKNSYHLFDSFTCYLGRTHNVGSLKVDFYSFELYLY